MKITIVGGCGHVGLPLGIALAVCGNRVSLLDLDPVKIKAVNSGRMPFMERGAEEQLASVIGTRLFATSEPECLREADCVIAVVGTPVDEHLNPTLGVLSASIHQTVDAMREGSLLILRSTVYPGVTKMVYESIRRKNRNIDVAFCPERLAEGNAMEELRTLPQIIAAFEPNAAARARTLFSQLTGTVVELEPLEAELAKLFTNSWRYLNFAISNQFYCLAESYGLDFHKIHNAVTREYPRMRSFASAGFAAGPCLLKDTLQLAAFSGNNFFLGHAAMLVNEGLPNFVVSQLRAKGRLSEKTVAILGMTFKADCDDNRESLSYKLKHLLELEALAVLCTDPYIADPRFVSLDTAIERADIVILGAPHREYRDLVLGDKTTVDVWGFWGRNSQIAASIGATAT